MDVQAQVLILILTMMAITAVITMDDITIAGTTRIQKLIRSILNLAHVLEAVDMKTDIGDTISTNIVDTTMNIQRKRLSELCLGNILNPIFMNYIINIKMNPTTNN